MKHIRIPLLVVTLSLMLTGMAFAIDLPVLTTWTGATGYAPGAAVRGTTVGGVGGGGPGFGDVLLAPLYDVRNVTDPNLPGAAGTTARAQYTLISIVNTDDVFGVVARIRFREWKRSREVLDFDIPLTTNDVWVGEVSRQTGGGAVIKSPESMYITNEAGAYPSVAPFLAAPIPANGIPFRTSLIETIEADPNGRTEYGYFEVIGEERVGAMTASGTIPRLAVPAVPGTVTDRDVGNVLMGTVYIIRPDVAVSHQYNMTAIANFATDWVGIWRSPTTTQPNLLQDVQGELFNVGAGGFNNLEALLTKRVVDFQYVTGLDPATQTPMSTSVVITFPTKWAHYATASPFSIKTVLVYPGGTPFTGAREVYGDQSLAPAQITPDYGEVIMNYIWDRAEHPLIPPTEPISPGVSRVPRLPWEVNVIGLYPLDPVPTAPYFRNNVVFATASAASGQSFTSGWGEIDLSPWPNLGAADTRVLPQGKSLVGTQWGVFNFFNNIFNAYRGLPAIGVVMTEFYNGTISGYYGNTVPWQYGVDWRTNGLILP